MTLCTSLSVTPFTMMLACAECRAASGEKNSQPASKAHAVPKVIANANKGYNQNPGTGKAQTAQSGTSSAINDAIDKHNAKFENMGR